MHHGIEYICDDCGRVSERSATEGTEDQHFVSVGNSNLEDSSNTLCQQLLELCRRNLGCLISGMGIHSVARAFIQVRRRAGKNIDIPPFVFRQNLGKIRVAFEYADVRSINAVIVV